MARLYEDYRKRIVPALMKKFEYKNVHQAPRLLKVVINVGAGEAVQDAKVLELIAADLGALAGQKTAITRAKRAISAFKIRAGMPIGVKVTLRGARMFEFIDRFFNFAAPRIRDFEGLLAGFVRRSGRLHTGIERTDYLPRARGIEDQEGLRHGHHPPHLGPPG